MVRSSIAVEISPMGMSRRASMIFAVSSELSSISMMSPMVRLLILLASEKSLIVQSAMLCISG